MNISPHYTAIAEERATFTVDTWQDAPEAMMEAAKYDAIEVLSDKFAGDVAPASVQDSLTDWLNQIEERLHELRREAIDAAVTDLHEPGYDDGEIEDQCDDRAMSVADAIQAARKARLSTVEIEVGIAPDTGNVRVAV